MNGEIARHFKSILPNLTSLTLAEVVFRSVNFISNVFIARYFTVSEFGKLGFITSFIAYFNIIIDFGFDIYGIREVAKSPSSSKLVFNQIISVKLFLALITFGLVGSNIFIFPIRRRTVFISALWPHNYIHIN